MWFSAAPRESTVKTRIVIDKRVQTTPNGVPWFAKPNQTKPNQTKPDQTKATKTKPTKTGVSRT